MALVGETSPLLTTNGHKQRNSNSDGSVSASSSSSHDHDLKSMMVGRGLLCIVAFLYGTLNVALRFVYELNYPPSASALSTTRGWLAVFCFVPLIIKNRTHR